MSSDFTEQKSPAKLLSLSFVFVVLTVILFAVGTQVVFSPKKITDRLNLAFKKSGLEKKLGEANVQVDFKKAQITLTGSLSYPVGIRIRNLSYKAKKDCYSLNGGIETLVVPLSLSKVLKNQFEIGLIRAHNYRSELINHCDMIGPKRLTESKRPKKVKPIKSLRVEKFLRSLSFAKEFEKSLETVLKKKLQLQGVLIYDLSLKHKKQILDLERTKFLIGQGDLRASLTSKGAYSKAESKMQLDLSSFLKDKKLKTKLKLKEKEGSLDVEVLDSFESSETALKFKASHLPVSFLTNWLDIKIKGVNLRQNWMHFDLEADVKDVSQLEFELKNFKITGDVGKLSLGSESLKGEWVRDKGWTQEKQVQFNLTDFHIDKILHPKFKQKVQGVVSQYGSFQSTLFLKDFKKLNGDFELKDWSFIVRSMGAVKYQEVLYARGSLDSVLDQSFYLDINDVDLKEGLFEGLLSLNYKSRTDYVDFKINVPVFKLKPKLVKTLFNVAEVSSVKLVGAARLDKNRLKGKSSLSLSKGKNELNLKLDYIRSKHWTSKGLSFSCKVLKDWHCKAKIKKTDFSKPLASDLGVSRLADFSGDLEYTSSDLTFKFNSTDGRGFYKWTPVLGPELRLFKGEALSRFLRDY